ncbi:YraN family protein, partial [Myxococcus sp. AM001]|nr:YraN family protein [Myxococcus sp. AM001]
MRRAAAPAERREYGNAGEEAAVRFLE